METKNFNSKFKAIKMPDGKASEYAKYSCNFYVGCSNECEYCYLKKGRGKKILGGNIPTLKKCFKDENHALEVFEKELEANFPELQKHGLFFSFTTDPMLPETKQITYQTIGICVENNVPVKILTKCADWVFQLLNLNGSRLLSYYAKYVSFGFTLTGHDELEPNASTNAERIEAMRMLHDAGFRTFVSIEPVIDFESSISMIFNIRNICYLIKVGLESGKKYDKKELRYFIERVLNISYGRTDSDNIEFKYNKKCWQMPNNLPINEHLKHGTSEYKHKFKIYFKEGLLKQAGISRSELPNNCVTRDYSLFNN